MRRLLFLSTLLLTAGLLPGTALAQRKAVAPAVNSVETLPDSLVALPTTSALEAETTQMCLLNFEGSGNPDTFVALDFGLGTKNKVYTPAQAELIKKIKAMSSATGALLLMRKQGWELNYAYVGPVSATKLSHFFLMRRLTGAK